MAKLFSLISDLLDISNGFSMKLSCPIPAVPKAEAAVSGCVAQALRTAIL